MSVDPAGPAPNVVFVASLGHSGSTLLELLLAAHPSVTGLGEIRSLLTALDADRSALEGAPCSCGRTIAACPFWGPLLDDLAATDDAVDRYRQVLDRAADRPGEVPAVLVDSSKNLAALDLLVATGRPVTAVHLVRDVRSWSISFRDRSRRKGELAWRDLYDRYGVRGPARRLRRAPLATVRLWHGSNLEIERRVRTLGLDAVTVGYEPLAFAPERVLSALARHLGLAFDPAMLRPDPAANHSVLGNRMAHDPAKLKGISYDGRWLTRREWVLASLLSPAAMRYNADVVYGRGR